MIVVDPWKPSVGDRCSVGDCHLHKSENIFFPNCPVSVDISHLDKVQFQSML